MSAQTRAVEPADLPDLLALNNSAVPAVNELDAAALAALVGVAHRAVVLVDDARPGSVLGFALALLPGADYDSENYRWFSGRSTSFLYVDRIVVAAGSRGLGLGPVLYDDLFAHARAASAADVFCEVNLEPPNPGSLAFHDRLGFVELGTQATKGGTVVVRLLSRPA